MSRARPTSPAVAARGAEPEVLLHARSITKRFGGLVAVNQADLVIPQGSIISLIGPNGAGKTTFFNVVAGILDPTEGQIEFRGRKMVARPERGWLEPFFWVGAGSARGHRPGLALGPVRAAPNAGAGAARRQP